MAEPLASSWWLEAAGFGYFEGYWLNEDEDAQSQSEQQQEGAHRGVQEPVHDALLLNVIVFRALKGLINQNTAWEDCRRCEYPNA